MKKKNSLESTGKNDTQDIYDLYVDFEKKLLEWSLTIANLESTREFFRRTFKLWTREALYRKLKRMSPKARAYNRRRWKRGFDAWLAKEQRKDERLREHINIYGYPPEIEEMVSERLQELRKILGENDQQRTNNKFIE